MGNFNYIDKDKPDYVEEMNQAILENLSFAIDSSKSAKYELTSNNFSQNLKISFEKTSDPETLNPYE